MAGSEGEAMCSWEVATKAAGRSKAQDMNWWHRGGNF